MTSSEVDSELRRLSFSPSFVHEGVTRYTNRTSAIEAKGRISENHLRLVSTLVIFFPGSLLCRLKIAPPRVKPVPFIPVFGSVTETRGIGGGMDFGLNID